MYGIPDPQTLCRACNSLTFFSCPHRICAACRIQGRCAACEPELAKLNAEEKSLVDQSHE